MPVAGRGAAAVAEDGVAVGYGGKVYVFWLRGIR